MDKFSQLPPSPRAIATILQDRGYLVGIRRNKHGSWRYTVDGGNETDALTMMKRFDRGLYPPKVTA